MKKLVFLLLMFLTTGGYAQKLNKDTLAKYSKKEEQLKVFNKIAADIHLDASQTENFNWLCSSYSFIAFAILQNPDYSSCDKLELLKKTYKEFRVQIKHVLSVQQIEQLKVEAEKNRWGQRFITFNY